MRFAIVALAATACGGSAEGAAPLADGGADSAHADAASIAGSLAITVTVVQNTLGIFGNNAPFAGCPARIELPGEPELALETTTDAMGVATFMVDPAQGPYDVTVASMTYTAVSVLGVMSPIPGSVVLYPVSDTPPFHHATGTISGTKSTTDSVALDSWYWQGVVQPVSMSAYYATGFWELPGSPLPLAVAALDVDTSGDIVNGFLTSSMARPTTDVSIDIAFPIPAVAADHATISIEWPSDGYNAGSKLTSFADPAAGYKAHPGNGIVVRNADASRDTWMLVGKVDATLPSNDISTATVQSYTSGAKPELAPDFAEVFFQNVPPEFLDDFGTFVVLRGTDLANGATITVPVVRAFTIAPADATAPLDVVQFGSNSDYAWTLSVLFDADASGNQFNLWFLYAATGTLAPRRLPHLPAGLKVFDIAGDTYNLYLNVNVLNYRAGAPPPWESATEDTSVAVQLYGQPFVAGAY